jgi:hypothetical protein
MPLSALLGGSPDGGWSLSLDLVNLDGKALEASASLQISSGTALGFEGRGKFNAETGESKLKLKGFEKGTKLKPVGLVTDPNGLAGGEIKYQVLGQRGTATEWTTTATNSCEE